MFNSPSKVLGTRSIAASWLSKSSLPPPPQRRIQWLDPLSVEGPQRIRYNYRQFPRCADSKSRSSTDRIQGEQMSKPNHQPLPSLQSVTHYDGPMWTKTHLVCQPDVKMNSLSKHYTLLMENRMLGSYTSNVCLHFSALFLYRCFMIKQNYDLYSLLRH